MPHILLIEPDAVLADLFMTGLKREGHTIDWHSSAEEAVRSADKKPPDVVILELELARHNGVEFLYEFRSYAEWAHVPVLVLSMVPELNLDNSTKGQLGILGCYYKPQTTIKTLLNAIENLKNSVP